MCIFKHPLGSGGNAIRTFFSGLILVGMLLWLQACAPVISPQLMQQVDKELTYHVLVADPEAFKGKTALLGGTIVNTIPKTGQTEIEVVQKELLSSGEPRLTDKSGGRFLVVVDRFLDPAIYKSERDLTVAGKVQGSVVRRIGEIDYRYPVIAALELHLWQPWPRRSAPIYPYGYSYPYWGWRIYPGYPY
jgi:outer membrane lipoprotein